MINFAETGISRPRHAERILISPINPQAAINAPRDATYRIMDQGDKAEKQFMVYTTAPTNAIEINRNEDHELQCQISTAFILISTAPVV